MTLTTRLTPGTRFRTIRGEAARLVAGALACRTHVGGDLGADMNEEERCLVGGGKRCAGRDADNLRAARGERVGDRVLDRATWADDQGPLAFECDLHAVLSIALAFSSSVSAATGTGTP